MKPRITTDAEATRNALRVLRATTADRPAAVRLCTFGESCGSHDCTGAAPPHHSCATLTASGTTPADAYFAYRAQFHTLTTAATTTKKDSAQ